DLADTLAGNRELLPDFFQRMVGVHADTEAHAQHAFLARGQRGQYTGRGFAQVGLDRRIDRLDRVHVLDEITEIGIFLVADRRFERDRLLGDLEHLANLVQGHLQLFAELFGRRFTADFVQHLPARADDLVDRLDHVHRDTDCTGLIRDGTRNRLADPPGRIGRELVAATILELIHGLHQPDIAFLDKIEELQAAVGVLLGDGNHETQVRLDHFLLGNRSFALALLHLVHDAAIFTDVQTGFGRQRCYVATDFADSVGFALGELAPALAFETLERGFPGRIDLATIIAFEELLALDAIALGKAQQAAFQLHQTLVDVVQLLDKVLDTAVVRRQRLDVSDDLGAECIDLLAI